MERRWPSWRFCGVITKEGNVSRMIGNKWRSTIESSALLEMCKKAKLWCTSSLSTYISQK